MSGFNWPTEVAGGLSHAAEQHYQQRPGQRSAHRTLARPVATGASMLAPSGGVRPAICAMVERRREPSRCSGSCPRSRCLRAGKEGERGRRRALGGGAGQWRRAAWASSRRPAPQVIGRSGMSARGSCTPRRACKLPEALGHHAMWGCSSASCPLRTCKALSGAPQLLLSRDVPPCGWWSVGELRWAGVFGTNCAAARAVWPADRWKRSEKWLETPKSMSRNCNTSVQAWRSTSRRMHQAQNPWTVVDHG